jgi:AraC-like DNA-binding protein
MSLPIQTPANPVLGRAATPIAFIRAIVLAYDRYGRDPAPALAQARIAPELLDDPAARVTAGQLEMFSGCAMQELDDEALGWYSRRLPWGTHGLLCRASLTAPTLDLALRRWCRHHRLLTEDMALALVVDGEAGVARFTLTPRLSLGPMEEFCLVSTMRYVLGYACWAVDSLIPLREVDFPFAEPAHSDVYGHLFQGRLRFAADHAAFTFDARYLDLPVRRDEAALQTMLQRALPLTVRQYRRDRLLVHRVRQVLREPRHASVLAEDVAEQLYMSARTLHRRLREEGTSLQAVKDEVRWERAVDLLNRSRRPIKQVAAQVGYRNEKSFIRAFTAWAGMPPGAYRALHSEMEEPPTA